ncbi:hypothetical protein [Legionella resiliens]|uniref:Uncharacterized protein n=1 Tax=Legionella resiliens TaxID=2905958 RepID=A0ABS8X6P6_9GAMM|nr:MULTISPECIES: hypothetical protein [unclassified Legionella]MCE0724093.1 hypothetical protein [Legionella sp. 9fVS26]MCE3533246.1 hypothetical protein [Legionella sp. 8cVS16]
MDAKIEKLKKINPINEEGIPKNKGNCQWCAIEGARVLLEGVEPKEIPNFEGGNDPLEERVHYKHGSDEVRSKESKDFFSEIDKLKAGELMIVSLESDDLDHAYIIYVDDEKKAHLIDPDRQVFVPLNKNEKNFHQAVRGWDEVSTVNYLNGDINSDFRSKVKVCMCVLNKAAVEHNPLPEYGSEPSEKLDY